MGKFKKIIRYTRDGSIFPRLYGYISRRLQQKMYGYHSIPIGNDYHDGKDGIYDSHRENEPFWIAEDESLKYFLGRIGPISNVLDAPFGTGRFAPLYHSKKIHIIALDISQGMIDQSLKKYPDVMGSADIHVQGISNIPYDDSSIDLICCFRFLPWIVSFEDVEASLQELSRVCGKYAILEFCVGKHENGKRRIYADKTLWNRKNEEELREWLLKFDFEIAEILPLHDDELHPGLSAFLCQKIN